jgi:hypothetical protein
LLCISYKKLSCISYKNIVMHLRQMRMYVCVCVFVRMYVCVYVSLHVCMCRVCVRMEDGWIDVPNGLMHVWMDA